MLCCQAYVDMFSKSLNLEYAKFGISVQNQAPAFVATKMSKIRKARLDAPTPAKWVESAIKHIGYEATSCPYWYVRTSMPTQEAFQLSKLLVHQTDKLKDGFLSSTCMGMNQSKQKAFKPA